MQMKLTSELTGAALDWAVAVCEEPNVAKRVEIKRNPKSVANFQPSTNWAQGGPIIDREKIGVTFRDERDEWEVPNWSAWPTQTDDRQEIMGETLLIAAMRCYVASKLGHEVDVPEEVVQ